jgi:hypothetical protein
MPQRFRADRGRCSPADANSSSNPRPSGCRANATPRAAATSSRRDPRATRTDSTPYPGGKNREDVNSYDSGIHHNSIRSNTALAVASRRGFKTGGPPETSNCYCHPGKAGGSPLDFRWRCVVRLRYKKVSLGTLRSALPTGVAASVRGRCVTRRLHGTLISAVHERRNMVG